MKILLCGANGQLGTELQKIIASGTAEIGAIPAIYKGAEVTPTDADTLDITDEQAVLDFVSAGHFDLIINCAAYTNVDACETNPELAAKINTDGAINLARAAAKSGAKLVQVSTDYVFSGKDSGERTEKDETAPISVYGNTKLLGEKGVLEACPHSYVVRTAWLYGCEGKNFVKTMLMLNDKLESWEVVSDQLGNPTSANDLAYEILCIAATDNYGIYHVTNEGTCSWFDFAQEILRCAGADPSKIKPCTSQQYQEKHPDSANRPAYSSLANAHLEQTIGNEMRTWQEALHTYFENYSH